jgi:hypothetical protein
MNPIKKISGVSLILALLLPAGASMAASAPTNAANAYDGVYSGTTHLIAGDATKCQPAGTVTVNVTHGRFHYAWGPRQDAIVPISSEGGYSAMLVGSFNTADKHMQMLPRIDGYANGSVLAGTYGTRWCTYSYQFNRQ